MATSPEGSIMPRGKGRWLVRLSLGFDERGKRKFYTKTILGTKADARAHALKILKKVGKGQPVQVERLSVAQLFEKWLETKAAGGVQERTLDDYTDIVHKRINPALGHVQVSELTTLAVQDFFNGLNARGLSASTLRNTKTVLNQALKKAKAWHGLDSNPVDGVDLPQANHRSKTAAEQYITQDDARRFAACASRCPRGRAYMIGILTGLRPSEYLALQWADINLDEGYLRVTKAVHTRKGGGWYFKRTKTEKSTRAVGLPPKAIPILIEHRARQLEARELAGAEYNNHDLVFANEFGKPLDQQNLKKQVFKRILKEAGLPSTLCPYALRHSYTTVQVENGEDISIVSKSLGHSSVKLTSDTYSHLTKRMTIQTAAKMDVLL